MSETTKRPMTISDAIDMYARCGTPLQHEIDQWIGLVQSAKLETPLSNANYFHALGLTEGMFRRICYRFLMLTGQGGDKFVGTLGTTIRHMLRRIQANQGDARIIIVNGDSCGIRQLVEEFPGVLSVCAANAPKDSQPAHFIVGDYGMVRQEQPHEPLENGSPADLIKANMYFANPGKVRLFTQWFDDCWKLLQPSSHSRVPLAS